MKKISRLLALIMSLVMVFSFCACSSDDGRDDSQQDSNDETEIVKDPYEEIAGEWRCELNVTEKMNEELETELDVDSIDSGDVTLVFPLVLTFEDDKTFHFEYDQDDIIDSFEGYIDWLCEWMTDYMMDMLIEQTGYSEDEINAVFESEYGMTLSAYVESLMDESIDIESLFDESEMEIDGYYKVEDGSLYLADSRVDFDDDSYITYTIEDDILTLVEINGDFDIFIDDINEFAEFPIEFNRN